MIGAYIDLGTNSFEMLIAEHSSSSNYKFLHRSIIPSLIGKGSYQSSEAQEVQISHARDALTKLVEEANSFEASYIMAAGTSAIRDYNLVERLGQHPNLNLRVISGEQEALLVKLSISKVSEHLKGPKAIIDIGGGSVELSVDNAVPESISLNVGVTRLKELLELPEQLDNDSILRIQSHLEKESKKLKFKCPIEHLIGCSGTMETLFSLHKNSLKVNDDLTSIDYKSLLPSIIHWQHSSVEERQRENRIAAFRKSLFPIGLCILNFYLKAFDIRTVYYSKFGLREGLFFEDLNTRYA